MHIHLSTFITGQLCQEDLEAFEKWSFDVNVGDASLLVETGIKEQILLGQRFKKRFPSFLSKDYDANSFEVVCF